MRNARHTLEITMGDFEKPIVLNNGEEAKEYVMSLLNSETYSSRWRGRGKRKQHAIANGLRARGFDQDLPLEFAYCQSNDAVWIENKSPIPAMFNFFGADLNKS